MKTYKFLPIENHEIISKKLYEYVVNNTTILEKKLNYNRLDHETVLQAIPELAAACLKIINHPITMIAIIHRSAGVAGGVHVDVNAFNYRVLWPVSNCQGSYTRFFDQNKNKLVTSTAHSGEVFFSFEEKNPLIEIDAVELVAPVVFNVRTPHGVFTNPTCTEPRLTATMGFSKFPLEEIFNGLW
jgi:hypothetical protein